MQADVVGRYAAGDQFGLSITGGGVSSGNTATTAGSTVGPQTDAAETAGPIAALGGTTYQIHKTAAGTGTLANYTLTASCVDTANGNAAVTLTPLVRVRPRTSRWSSPSQRAARLSLSNARSPTLPR